MTILKDDNVWPYQKLVTEQNPPTPNDQTPVWDLVLADMRARDAIGRERYGTPLQTHNGRDALVDAYQEALDQVVYLRQAIEERGLSVLAIPHRQAMADEIRRLQAREQELLECNTRLVLERQGKL